MAKVTPRKSKKSRKPRKKSIWASLRLRIIVWTIVFSITGFAVAYFWIDYTLQQRFGNPLWDVPVHVYSRSFEIYPGLDVTQPLLIKRLKTLGFRHVSQPLQSGEYATAGNTVDFMTRPFTYWDGPQEKKRVRIAFDGNRVTTLSDMSDGSKLSHVRLKPQLISSLSQLQHEDRYLLQLDKVPKILLETLIAVEDKKFATHVGVDFIAILRSFIANIRAGKIVQGGSTITQQLIKNVYGANEKTYRRKLLEIAMALVMEQRYEKHQILEFYCNEVFLGQDGNRAIHGFGLASRFYFDRPVEELNALEAALLVGMIKAPSAYNPRRNPQQATKRRLTVLRIMLDEQLISEAAFNSYKDAPLGIVNGQGGTKVRFATFLDAVNRQLLRRLDSEQLKSGNFAIFTTMDYEAQTAAELALEEELRLIEKDHDIESGKLQGVVIIVQPDSGEVFAMVGGRNLRRGTFNRALDSARPIGSLVKPLVYLTAFENDPLLSLTTSLNDKQFVHKDAKGEAWSPRNYDEEYRGKVSLIDALAHSYNVPTARLGLKIGTSKVASNLEQFGATNTVNSYPSLLLGATELSPMEVAQVYQAIANLGYRIRLRTISNIAKDANAISDPVPLNAEQVTTPEAAHLTVFALQEAVRKGTARSLNQYFGSNLRLAGKTGTTNNYRDSWFAGFAGNLLTVVWIGRDDNQSTGLTGSSGALRVWRNTMQRLNLQQIRLSPPDTIKIVEIDPETGLRAGNGCKDIRKFPFAKDAVPKKQAPCTVRS